MNRRGFLKFAAGGTVGLAASPIIWNTLYDAVYWTQNWGWIPRLQQGEEVVIPAVSKLCPSGTGLRVRVVDGRPVRALGNPDNAMSQGALTALAAAETQLMVSPSRLKTPLRRSADGAYVAISWEEAERLLVEKTREAGASIACVSGDPTSSVNEVFSAFLNSRGSRDFYFMPDEEQAALRAWHAMGGKGRIGYDLEGSDFILAIGANVLESWGTVARNRKVYSAGRPAGKQPTLKLAYAGPTQNNTAAGADWWLPVKPGTELALALGVAHLLIKNGRAAHAVGLPGMEALAASYTPEKVAEITGVDPKRLADVTAALAQAAYPLVVVGSEWGAGGGAGPIMAGIAVNMLLGRVGKRGNLVDLPFPHPVLPGADEFRAVMNRDFVAYASAVAADKAKAPALLMVYDANPLYALPKNSGAAGLLENAGFKVALASFMSETCAACDLVLPAAMGLERFDDVYTPYGSGQVNYSVTRPVAKPYYQTRPAAELVLALEQELGTDPGVRDMPSLLDKKARALGGNVKLMLQKGEVLVRGANNGTPLLVYDAAAIASAAGLARPEAPVKVAPVTVLGMGTAQTGIPPFATRIITEYQLQGAHSVAQMNAATAAKLGVKKGDRLKLDAQGTAVTVLADVYEGVPSDTVALCTGLGHTAFDEFSRNKGANITTLAGVLLEPGTGLPVWDGVSVNAVRA